ncbi:hypothetical protein ACIBG8_54410 [Nonomuraea sp. NPDC050556]|uniref:hypothetical protein n=1 Tax=Nonomuraea sp. NPDC050556 TaxID=3364369 RepID=UPI0037992203
MSAPHQDLHELGDDPFEDARQRLLKLCGFDMNQARVIEVRHMRVRARGYPNVTEIRYSPPRYEVFEDGQLMLSATAEDVACLPDPAKGENS